MQNIVPKGKRKVKKSRTYFDDKGYMVNEDYTSYEDCDDVPAPSKKEPVKKINLTQQPNGSKIHSDTAQKGGAAAGKQQSSLSAFFGKRT